MPAVSTLLYALGWLVFVGYVLTTLEFLIGNRSIRHLDAFPPLKSGPALRVSVIIPARNEARNIEEALTSVLHLDYPDYEIVALDDRSEDETGAILDRMAERYPQLKVVHVSELPPGWLGKNHALYAGARDATGELLLFTDADIVMAPDTLSRAVSCLESRCLDHLALMPEIVATDPALRLFLAAFTVFFSLYARPWYAKVPWLPCHIGVGAFNLIRRDVYERIGTHQAIAMRPDDDMKLGKLVKKHGFRQDVAYGPPLVRVEWYASLGELIQGLMKNAFAGLDYNLPLTLAGVSAQFLFGVWPVLALFLTDGVTWWLHFGAFLLMQVLFLDNARYHRMSLWAGLAFPITTLIMIYIILRATWITLKHDGIRWRGTHYPLSALKANRV